MRRLAMFAMLAAAGLGRADFLVYDPPGIPILVTLEGKTDKINRTYTLKTRAWPEELKFFHETVRIYKSELPREKLVKKMKALASGKAAPGAEELWQTGRDCLMGGAPGAFFEACELLEQRFPAHHPSKLARTLAARWEAEVPADPREEEALRRLAPNKPNMKLHRTEHFAILHDIDIKKQKGERFSRLERRCNLIERVYKSYLAFLNAQGRDVPMPRERMRVVFFKEESDFQEAAAAHTKGDVKDLAGFYHRTLHACFFYDNASSKNYRALAELVEELRKLKTTFQRNGNFDMVQTLNALDALKEIEREQEDMETISHEIIHHVSAATELQPRDSPCPKWAAEGLACFFESPSDCTWAGIGAVNERRLEGMREGAKKYSNQFELELVAKDGVFGSNAGHEIAYAHGWAFTHFMMNRHFDLLADFYRELGKLPRFNLEKLDAKSGAEYDRLYEAAFRKAIPPAKWPSLESEWKAYHDGLKTDFERAVGQRQKRRDKPKS